MTYEEAILRIKEHNRIHQMVDPVPLFVTNALDMSVAALEKQIPKKIKIIDGYDFCPTCSYKYGSDAMRRMLYHWDQPFCKKCGQRLDWKVDGKEQTDG